MSRTALWQAFFEEARTTGMPKIAAKKIKSNDRMPARSKANVSDFESAVRTWDNPHRDQAVQFMEEHGPGNTFEMLHSMRRWYSGQTMGGNLLKHREALSSVMKLDPEDVVGVYRGFKVPKDHPLAKAKPGDEFTLPVTRNKGMSSWTTDQTIPNRFSGAGKGKVGIIVELASKDNVKPVLAPPSHTEPWFNALYEHVIGKSFRPGEGEYLVSAPEVRAKVVKVKK